MDTTTPARRNIVQRLGDWLANPTVATALLYMAAGANLHQASSALRAGNISPAILSASVCALLVAAAASGNRRRARHTPHTS